MSIFIKAGLWIEKKIGYDGELNINSLIKEYSQPVGTTQLDFGFGNKTAEVIVTGIPKTTLESKVVVVMRIEATYSHTTDDLLIDPIRLAVKSLVPGVGFTVYGEMDNALANGLYKVDWFLSNK
jgi:hypothetical protein